jgi:hypothetical protein
LASVIGANIKSGGIGKKEDSAKLNVYKYAGACGCRDHSIILLYNREKSCIVFSIGTIPKFERA